MKIIKKIEIQNFRSLQKVSINCEKINVFGGLNDAGKSNVLKALNLYFNGQTDFLKNIVFHNDYSKIALASAQRAGKKKQQIKIKIYFYPPVSFSSLRDEKEIYLEKIYDRLGDYTVNYSTDDAKKKSQITRLINKIKYFYIPALKGPDVMQFLLGKVGEHRLISPEQIENLNKEVNENLGNLKKILSDSEISIKTTVGLPVLVRDFWEKLTLNTEYDQFSDLQTKIMATQKGKQETLTPELYQVPIMMRGEGMKSKFIPPLLKWIQEQTHDIFVWGIDEPENSLEFRKAEEIARLYFSEYARNTQIFLTTHSFSFLFPQKYPSIEQIFFRCFKNDLGATTVSPLENLFAKEEKMGLAEDLGALEIQKEAYLEWKEKDRLLRIQNLLIEKHQNETKPILYVEGPADKAILECAWNKLNPSNEIPFLIEGCGGAGFLANFIKNKGLTVHNRVMIALWDCDQKGYGELMGFFKNNDFRKVSSEEIKRRKFKIYGLVLPTPEERSGYTNISSEDSRFQFLELEHYFNDKILYEAKIVENTIESKTMLKKNRKPLIKKIINLDSHEFANFEPLFTKIRSFLNQD